MAESRVSDRRSNPLKRGGGSNVSGRSSTARGPATSSGEGSRRRVAGGQPPFGYRSESGRLIPDEHEQQTLGVLMALVASGVSDTGIAGYLNSRPDTRPRRAEYWAPATVRSVRLLHAERRTRADLDATRAELRARVLGHS
jgi:hypothetical protein